MVNVRNAAATVAEAKLEGITDMGKFFKHQLFLAGLSDILHEKTLEAKNDTFAQSLELARELEAIQLDHKRSLKIAAVKAELQPEEARTIAWESLSRWPQFEPGTTGSHLRRISLGPTNKVAPMALGTTASCVAIAKRKDTCRRNATPASMTRCPWWMPMASPMTTGSTTLPRMTSLTRSTKTPRWGHHQLEPLPPFKLVSSSDSAPAQSCSPAIIENALQFLYNKIMIDAINEIKQTLKPSFRRPYLTLNLQNCTSIKGLYDTGADISCVSEKYFRQIPLNHRPVKLKDGTLSRFKTAGGQPLTVRGWYKFNVKIGTKTLTLNSMLSLTSMNH
jgi:hypothetical protein